MSDLSKASGSLSGQALQDSLSKQLAESDLTVTRALSDSISCNFAVSKANKDSAEANQKWAAAVSAREKILGRILGVPADEISPVLSVVPDNEPIPVTLT